jgi:hypothetical protein
MSKLPALGPIRILRYFVDTANVIGRQVAYMLRLTSPRLPTPLCTCTADDALPKFFKTSNGVRVQELRVGQGPQAQQGDAVLIDFVLRRANGYFIYGEFCTTKAASCAWCLLLLSSHVL